MRVEEASKLLGMNDQTLRIALQQKLFPFGVAVKRVNSKGEESTMWTYYINDNRLKMYLEGTLRE